MMDVPDFLTPPLVMGIVAALLAAGAAYVVMRPSQAEGAAYIKRIVGTMLGAGAITLGGFAVALASWGPGR